MGEGYLDFPVTCCWITIGDYENLLSYRKMARKSDPKPLSLADINRHYRAPAIEQEPNTLIDVSGSSDYYNDETCFGLQAGLISPADVKIRLPDPSTEKLLNEKLELLGLVENKLLWEPYVCLPPSAVVFPDAGKTDNGPKESAWRRKLSAGLAKTTGLMEVNFLWTF